MSVEVCSHVDTMTQSWIYSSVLGHLHRHHKLLYHPLMAHCHVKYHQQQSGNAANKEVMANDSVTKKRGSYQKYTPKQKATIGNYALINGTSTALRHYAGEFPDFKYTTICEWKRVFHLVLETIHPYIRGIPARTNQTVILLSIARSLLLPRGSSPSISAYVLRKLQCKQLRKFFLRNFSLLKYLDFYENFTLRKFGAIRYITIE